MRPDAIARMTYDEYLAFEATSDTKHEYVNGEVFAMAGGTITHGALAMAVGTALSIALRDSKARQTACGLAPFIRSCSRGC